MKIKQVILTKSYTGFYFDDQKAIKKDAKKDGFMYIGEAMTDGFKEVRVPGEAVSVQLLLENGDIAVGDCAAVQYSGAGGRDPLFLAEDFIPFIEKHISPFLVGEDVLLFKPLAEKYDRMKIDGNRIHTAIRYGITQALLSATAISTKRTMAEVIRDEYHPTLKTLHRIPIFAQSGDDRYTNVDKMILKEVDSMPHALINNVKEKLGYHGEILKDYVIWMRDRVLAKRTDPNYLPVFHIDLYGTLGIAFNNDIEKIVTYLIDLAETAKPFFLRIEGPIDTGDREGTMIALREITKKLDEVGTPLEIVADEWCNTVEDIKYFADQKAGHMLQIKTPDLGGINNIAEAILYCKEKKIGAYCGGTCNETNISAEATTSVAIACEADLCLAKPAMDVDSGYMIVNNMMERVIAISKARK
ncbi:MAG: methylaspartate ammonia-lyase [Tenericutes bacterium GWC2_34_14]|nr:MAG: methylaspartate ammonia-lyase [Tenericutes bacterium GWA2_35_7]OHE28240.1 MAG: methylaspartate ammonia-lyase [Tenericutes bacterium GWC2_34_14]OHE33134.1 MAG: methylaspartate ammonia-lyase [Tenericutes bacterium GWE2_34_108]OHE36254.1 MAG: methylaspartate ammonia-lyase [Tenericutes bacterium GWF1_35_14]OHE38704.1 MAG: methylaspartate ammonia-lyase [Tenericutes bacterium GWF2_35_184]OHE44796.1 MAG: methylaspartate ammonia-lyase [Tenericutes bacterium RIFOXYA2_FULL_36_32]OHE47857.1 MAG: